MARTVTSYKERGRIVPALLTLSEGDSQIGDGNDEARVTYQVSGMSPWEARTHTDIRNSIRPPEPPMKKRAAAPLDGKLDASSLGVEEFQDENDPTYKEEYKQFLEHEFPLMVQRATTFQLMTCVKGFDLTDEEIKAELGQDAHAREPLEELLLRLDQVAEIIWQDFDHRHMNALCAKIGELTGVRQDRVNFT